METSGVLHVPEKSVAVIGFMGVGKTTVGRALADYLKRPFIDSDALIEESLGMTIPDIFSTMGEHVFRRHERGVVLEYIRRPGLVISLGGGAFLNPEVRDMCLQRSWVLHLDMSWEYWLTHRFPVIAADRPLLKHATLREIRELFESRRSLYAAHTRLLVEGMTPEQAAQELAAMLEFGRDRRPGRMLREESNPLRPNTADPGPGSRRGLPARGDVVPAFGAEEV